MTSGVIDDLQQVCFNASVVGDIFIFQILKMLFRIQNLINTVKLYEGSATVIQNSLFLLIV